VKAAAAVLGASLLFFLGVLTGAGRRESVAPPTAIPLGVVSPAGRGGAPATPSRAPRGARSDASFEDRLAGIWAMVAELDPELARRMPRYDPARRPGPTRASGPGPDPGASGGTTRE